MPDFIKIPDKPALYQAADTANIKAVVGGINMEHFAPSVNVSFKMQSGEEKFFFNICDDVDQIITVGKSEDWNGNKLAIKDGDVESTYELFNTSLKVERIFDTKPTVKPRFKLTHSPDIIPYKQKSLFEDYQDLVQDWVAEGETPSDLPQTFEEYNAQHERPDDVVNSYALYCNKRNHIKDKSGNTIVNYATGKVGHIYAVAWEDAEGKKEWVDQNIVGTTLECDLPSQEWLDNAVLPIKLDPDIGYTTAGGSSQGMTGALYGVKYTTASDESGTLESMSIAWMHTNVTYGRYAELGLYEGTIPGSSPDAGEILSSATGTEYDSKVDEANDFMELDFSGESFEVSASTDYWAALILLNSALNSANDARYYYDTTPTRSWRYNSFTRPWQGLGIASSRSHSGSIFFTIVDFTILPIYGNQNVQNRTITHNTLLRR